LLSLMTSLLLIPCSSFCFYCSVHHRALHSFPTRRSSDLIVYHLKRLPGFSGGIVDLAAEFGMACNNAFCEPHCLAQIFANRNGTDRKSTRLNSSHGSISYAVFCLKKKKKLNKRVTI